MQHRTISRVAALAVLTLSAAAAQADSVTEYADLDASQSANSPFIKGNGTSKSTGTATGNQVYWFNATDNSRGAALGTAADTVLTVKNTTIRADNSTTPSGRIAKLTQNSADYGKSALDLDLGSQLLASDRPGMQVSGSSISVIDFGNAGTDIVHFDFKIGLWDGSQLTQASDLSQLNFSTFFGGVASNTGAVTYLGGGTFRFTETGTTGTSGTDLVISSALNGSFVRSLDIVAFGDDSGGTFSGDYVDLAASRTLTTAPVPEPASGVLLGAGGLMLCVLRLWRRKSEAQSRD